MRRWFQGSGRRRVDEATEARVQLAVDEAFAYTEQRFADLSSELRDQRQHLPGFLNAVATVPALAFELRALKAKHEEVVARARALEERLAIPGGEAAGDERPDRRSAPLLEGFRRLIAGTQKPASNGNVPTGRIRIVDEAKVDAARRADDIRLNLRCGSTPLAGYLNVDLREAPGIDILADVDELPFEAGSIAEISCAHVLEFISQVRLGRLLPYWRGLLKPNGTFRAVVPDGEAMLQQAAAGVYSFSEFRQALFGADGRPEEARLNLFTPDSLADDLARAGFREVDVSVRGRRSGGGFELEVSAKAP